ncbi:MAG: PorT family protein [Bacteroidaceae bacterium]|nr:PorT family protein [Bacteroidaceae bacterium]MCF0186065.1 PorT family protein [Bacteroidaceae bacterium]
MWSSKLGCSLALAVSLALPVRAQVGDSRSDLAIGFTGGVNITSVSFTPTIKQSSLIGPNFGATIRYTCEKYFTCICAIQLECNYAQMGWKERIEDGSGNEYNCQMNYVQVPLLCRLAWGRERSGAQGYLVLGPQAGFYLNKKENYGGKEPWDVSKRPNNVTHQYGKEPDKKFDYGIALGAGLQVSGKHIGHFLLEARYYYGLGDFYDNSKKGYFGRSGHSAIQVKVGYLFDILKTKNPSIK